MLKDNLLKYGVLKCRDLVELYFGWRAVTTVIQIGYSPTATVPFQLFGPDPRRIRYEVIFASFDAASQEADLATKAALDSGNHEIYAVPPGGTIKIERNFLTDLEAVTLDQWCALGTATLFVSTRQTFLTPAPVDEVPIG